MLGNKKIDISIDVKCILAKRSDGIIKLHPSHFNIEGICNIQSTGGLVEIEFMESQTMRRSIIYASNSASFLILPKGVYQIYYRVIRKYSDTEIKINIISLGTLGKVVLLARKAVGLGFSHKRWATALRSLVLSRSRAVGISLSGQVPASLKRDYNRPPVTPATSTRDPAVSIIIPTKVRHDLLKSCVTSLSLLKNVSSEIIIIDNGATSPEMLSVLEKFERDRVARVVRLAIPFNFSTLCNFGASHAKNPLLLFLNDDVEALDGHWLSSMCGYVMRDDVGVVGARLLYPSRDLQHGGIATHLVPGPGHPWRNLEEAQWTTHSLLNSAGEVDAVTGACLLIKKPVFEKVGGFDEVNFAVAMNDVDLCLKVRRLGLKVIMAPQATLIHKEGQTRPSDESGGERRRHASELRKFLELYPDFARQSVFYPLDLRRDTETASPIL